MTILYTGPGDVDKNDWPAIIVAFVAITLTAFMIYACTPDPDPPVSPIATPTETAIAIQPTPTSTPNPTSTPTLSPTPTNTATPTETPTSTNTPGPTETPTPEPTVESVCELARVYTVQPDDWLSKIARRFYGDWQRFDVIVNCTNRAALSYPPGRFRYIDDPHWIYPGDGLLVPQ